MRKLAVKAGDYQIRLYLSNRDEAMPMVFLNDDFESGEAVAELLKDLPLNLAVVEPDSWENQLTPWPAPALQNNSPDFGGKGDSLIEAYREIIIPEVERLTGAKPSLRIIAGHSLAGLWGIYAGWGSGLFQRVAASSASLWYEGFLDYLEKNPPAVSLQMVQMSLGRKEEKARNPRLAKIGTASAEAVEIMKQRGVAAELVMTEGGHFSNVDCRLAETIRRAAEI